ncbi:glycosyltransferase [Flavobacterium sp. NST-5]|uniref:Glycosyltransferase n=1 Tax=Flavobacterium ichthyis TaxID=2698827 RepID=A0ABW9Z7H3_9FLAO|nr:glycosyltransferase family A protein [Flavobacterium ichthyis]NBL64817.1 glycosyltransferase [Flavobacterium ichthyis]
MISVVIPLYNKEKSITDTINSVLAQTFTNFELIIVNDGSKDNSLEVVQRFSDDRIVVVDKPNGGVSSARNQGILNAKNEYIAFLDGDDIWHHKHLEVLAAGLLEHDAPDVAGIGTSFYKSNSKLFEAEKFQLQKVIVVEDYCAFMTSPYPRFNSSTLLVKKSKVMETGLFDEQLKYGEDVKFWYNLFTNFKLLYTPTVTAIYFIAAENRSVHYVMPLEKRFHKFDYTGKSKSEKRYLDKLVALILIDYFNQRAFKQVFTILKMYSHRIFGVFNYVSKLIVKKIS